MKFYGLLAWFGLTLAQVTYEGQQLLDCKVSSPNVAEQLSQFDVFSHKHGVSTVRVINEEQKQLVNAITECSVKVADLSKLFPSTPKEKLVRRGNPRTCSAPIPDDKFFTDYQSYKTLYNQYKHWAKKNPKYATFVPSIGKSIEGRDIFAIEISNQISKLPKRDIIYVGGQHAREWISPASVSYITSRLLADADKDPKVKSHLDHFVYRIVPLANPDGYEYTRTHDRLWRKNRRHNFDGTFGVDLNRNWDDHWAVVGSSYNTSAETYHGLGPASEPEVKSISEYIQSFPNRYGGIDWHAYGQLILRNWGWTMTPSTNEPIIKKMGDSVRDAFNSHGYNFTSDLSAGLYPAAGALDDYMATKGKLVSLTIELCPDDDEIGFELPPSQLLKCAQAAYSGSKQFSQFLLENPNIPLNGFN